MNRIYEIDEGRPVWKLRPLQLVLTLAGLLLASAVAVMLAISGPIAETVGNAIGAGPVAVTIWNIAKWPVILVCVVLAVAVLYYATPNVKQPKFRWISIGAGLAILMWVVAVGVIRLLRRELRQLQQDLRHARRRDRLPVVALDHQPGACSSAPNWMPNSNAAVSCRRGCPPSANSVAAA